MRDLVSHFRLAPVLVAGVWLPLLLLILSLSLKGYHSFQLGTYGDDTKYVVLARSIAFTDTYGAIVGPGPPLPTGYPFGFPLLLAPMARLYPNAPEMMKVESLVATLLNVSLLLWGWPLLGRTRSRWWAVAVVATYAVMPNVIAETRMIMSEAVFTALVLMSLLLTEHVVRYDGSVWGRGFALGIALASALFVRTIGVVLYAVVCVRLLLARRGGSTHHLAAIFGGGLALLVPVLLFTPVTVGNLLPTRYVQTLQQPSIRGAEVAEDSLSIRILRGVYTYARKCVREVIIPAGGGSREGALGQALGLSDLPSLIGLVVSGLILVGAVVSQWSGYGFAPSVFWFEVLYLGALPFWHYRTGRLLYPVQPFLLYQFLAGIRVFVATLLQPLVRAKPAIGRLPDAASVLVCALLFAVALYRDAVSNDDIRHHVRDFRVGSAWLKEQSPPDAIVMAEEPQTIHLYSGRGIVPYPPMMSEEELQRHLNKYGVSYILVAPRLEWSWNGTLDYDDATQTLIPILETLATAQQLRLVYESPPDRVRIYRVGSRQ